MYSDNRDEVLNEAAGEVKWRRMKNLAIAQSLIFYIGICAPRIIVTLNKRLQYESLNWIFLNSLLFIIAIGAVIGIVGANIRFVSTSGIFADKPLQTGTARYLMIMVFILFLIAQLACACLVSLSSVQSMGDIYQELQRSCEYRRDSDGNLSVVDTSIDTLATSVGRPTIDRPTSIKRPIIDNSIGTLDISHQHHFGINGIGLDNDRLQSDKSTSKPLLIQLGSTATARSSTLDFPFSFYLGTITEPRIYKSSDNVSPSQSVRSEVEIVERKIANTVHSWSLFDSRECSDIGGYLGQYTHWETAKYWMSVMGFAIATVSTVMAAIATSLSCLTICSDTRNSDLNEHQEANVSADKHVIQYYQFGSLPTKSMVLETELGVHGNPISRYI